MDYMSWVKGYKLTKRNLKSQLNVLYFLNIVSLLLFMTIVYGILSNSSVLVKLDQNTKGFIESIQVPWLNILIISLTEITNEYVFLLLSLIAVIILFYKNKRANGIWLLISLIIGLLLELSIKSLISRARPSNAIIDISGYSFPSGHAVIAVIFFLILILSFKSIIKGFISRILLTFGSFTAVILILFSRLYLNAHWLSDVISGVFLAFFIVSSIYLVFRRYDLKIEI